MYQSPNYVTSVYETEYGRRRLMKKSGKHYPIIILSMEAKPWCMLNSVLNDKKETTHQRLNCRRERAKE